MTENDTLTTVRPEVLTTDDVMEMVPRLQGHRRLVDRLFHWLKLDEINEVHRQSCAVAGPECATAILRDALNITVKVSGKEVLDRLPEGAFITVSNHPLGALDGIALI